MATRRVNCTLSLLIGGVVAAVAAIAWAQDRDDVLVIEQPVNRDVYAAHSEVEVRSTIDGDLVAAGRRVLVVGNLTGDIFAAAQNIEIQSEVGDDVRAAGQIIRINAPVSGHVVAAGQSVTVSQDVGDWAWLAGNTVEVHGNVGDDLRIRATTTTVDAEVAGDVEVVGDALNLGPNAVVRGNVRWRSDNRADISPDAQIDGEFIEEPSPGLAEDVGSGRALSFTLTVIVAVTVLFSLFPQPLRATADRIAMHPFASLVLGFAVMVAMPVLAIILVFSPLSAWFGLAVLGIYVVTLFLSVMTGLFAVSDLALRRFRSQPAMWHALTAIFVTVVAVGLLTYVPYLGAIAVLAIWLLGIGALSWGTWVSLRNTGNAGLQQS